MNASPILINERITINLVSKGVGLAAVVLLQAEAKTSMRCSIRCLGKEGEEEGEYHLPAQLVAQESVKVRVSLVRLQSP